MESNDPAFILYTSGSTGKPKGVIHGHGGYMVGIYATLKYVFDIKPDDIFWSTADAGWITGHSYILYSPLINGITTFVYEGTPDFPDIEIWWKLIDKYKVTKFYTAPTAVRALMKFGEDHIKKYDLSSLKILGSVGEPINPEAWLWFYKNVGREKLPIMDTWWQTETGMFIVTPVPSVKLKPGSAFKPFFGVEADVVDDQGNKVPPNTQGYLIIRKPWPAMLLDIYNNPTKYKETYFEKIKFEARNPKYETNSNVSNLKSSNLDIVSNLDIRYSDFIYFAGDSAKIDEDGYYWIVGRNDDVIKVSGHRLGSAELESAFVSNLKVAEAAVIGKPHEVKGESIKAFIILKQGVIPSDELKAELVQTVRKSIGPIATPDEIDFVDKLPKTRSGKIMRRILKAQELGLPVGDISTLDD
jgi:acetyl-CoA synthetase